MALERRNPLPPGRYWQDILLGKQPMFEIWLRKYKGTVILEERTENPNADNIESSTTTFLFRTTAPVQWDQKNWGYPTKAGANVQTQSDTVDKPKPTPSFTEQLSSIFDDGKTMLFVAVGLYFLSQGSGNGGRRRRGW